MLATQEQKDYSLIVGMGTTGMSIARFLKKNDKRFHFFDTRETVQNENEIEAEFPEASRFFANIDQGVLLNADEIYISPGVSRSEPHIARAIDKEKSVVGDIELFFRHNQNPVVGITGSNGKSTVTTLVGLSARNDGLDVGVGGNIGVPALDLLAEKHSLYVLELSSFQLESTFTPGLKVACHLNLSEDHMDRYDSLDAYAQAKMRIFRGASRVVFNLEDARTHPDTSEDIPAYAFGMHRKRELKDRCFWYSPVSGLLMKGDEPVVHKDELKIKGRHNISNALAVLAICEAIGVSQRASVQALKSFAGLPHRCEFVGEYNGVVFINDSKATNVGACIAAIEGLAPEYKDIVLIAGGEGKGADFSVLSDCINTNVKALVLIGKDAKTIASTVSARVDIIFASDMAGAVFIAREKASAGGIVLLSPACASLDMYSNFEARGRAFIDCVKQGEGLRHV